MKMNMGNWDEQSREEALKMYQKQMERTRQKKEDVAHQNRIKWKKITTFAIKKIAIGIGVVLGIFLIFSILGGLKKDTTLDLIEQLQIRYRGKFTIVSSSVNDIGNGYYEVQDENGITFSAIKNGTSQNNDYREHLLKQYLQEYTANHTISHFYQEDATGSSNFYRCIYGVRLQSYSELEQAIRDLYELQAWLGTKEKQVLKKDHFYCQAEIALGDFKGQMSQSYYEDVEDYIFDCKNQYLQYLHEKQITDQEVTEQEIATYFRPKTLSILVTGIEPAITLEEAAIYQVKQKDYVVWNVDLEPLWKAKGTLHTFTNAITSFEYQGVEYRFTDQTNLAKHELSNYIAIRDLASLFAMKVDYDYEAGTVTWEF